MTMGLLRSLMVFGFCGGGCNMIENIILNNGVAILISQSLFLPL